MLYRVTLTGADNSVDPSDLKKLSDEFPFVEWGILIGSQAGVVRMPSLDWINQLINISPPHDDRMHLALHVCGQRLRNIISGDPDLHNQLSLRLSRFRRVQLNFHGGGFPIGTSATISNAFLDMYSWWSPEIIFQLDGVNDHLRVSARENFHCSGLFDRSHGGGILPESWPKACFDIPCGYAGGLGPDNVVEELYKINKVATRPFWIDMETKLYNDEGKFDLGKCRSVLEQMVPFVGKV